MTQDRETAATITNALVQSMTPEFLDLMLRAQAQYGTQEAAERLAETIAEGVTARLYNQS